jgi:hypothetical protein
MFKETRSLRVGLAVITLYAIATAVCVVTIFAWLQDWETIGIGFIIPLFILPAIIAYVLCSAWAGRFRHAAYSLLALPLPLWCLYTSFFSSSNEAHEITWIMAVLLFVGAAAVSLADHVFKVVRPSSLMRPNADRCTACGYPKGSSPVCTECGTPVSDS